MAKEQFQIDSSFFQFVFRAHHGRFDHYADFRQLQLKSYNHIFGQIKIWLHFPFSSKSI